MQTREYKDGVERAEILSLKLNEGLVLVEEQNLVTGNYLIF